MHLVAGSRIHLPSPESRRRAIRPMFALGVVAAMAGVFAVSLTGEKGYPRSAAVGLVGAGWAMVFAAAGFLALERRARPRHTRAPTVAAYLTLGLAAMMGLSSIIGFAGGATEPGPPKAVGAPVDSRLADYLDARWASKAPEEVSGDVSGAVVGGLVVVNVDGRSLLFNNWWDAHPDGMAEVAEQVQTVVLVWSETVDVGHYEDGATGWRHNYWVRIVDFDAGQIVGDAYVRGGDPPDSKTGAGDRTGDEPDLVRFLDRHRPPASKSPSD